MKKLEIRGIQMTPRALVMAALRGGFPDRMPFTVYENKIPQCHSERELRNRGLCIVQRTQSYKICYPNVETREYHYTDRKGRNLIQTVHTMPCGTLSLLDEPAGFTRWHHEYPFKSPDDYKSILHMIKDAVIKPCYSAAATEGEAFGLPF